MCQFLSAVVTAKCDVFTSDVSDSHEDIIEANNLDESKIVRVEYTSDTLADITTYKLKIDQDEIPDWWNDGIRDKAERRLCNMARRMILTTGEYNMLLGGKWVLGGDVKVKTIKSALIIEMRGSSRVGTMLGSSRVGVMWESSQVGDMRGSSQVGDMRGSSRVGEMWESSRVGEMRESSQVGEMLESSRVGVMWETSKIISDNRIKKDK